MLELSSEDKEKVRARAIELGACRCGFAQAQPVEEWAQRQYAQWIDEGKNASMEYCEHYRDVRNDPRLLLEGAATVICCAFAYPKQGGMIAAYALGLDYHYVIKDKLRQLGAFITERWGGEVRPLVDTAPMSERYWAKRSGLGFEGINNMLIVPGVGSYVFLGELLWTEAIPADKPIVASCKECMQCVKACPGKALSGKGAMDANRCVSYLTIEHRGVLPDDIKLGASIYGCDMCQRVCPHNLNTEPIAILPEFLPRPEMTALEEEDFLTMTPSHYKKLVAHSAMRRAPLSQIIRNIEAHRREESPASLKTKN